MGISTKGTYPAATGYVLWIDIFNGLLKLFERGVGSTNAAGSWSTNIGYNLQLFTGPGVQEASVNDNTTSLITIATASTLFDAIVGFAGFVSGSGHATEIANNFLWTNERNIRVDGLGSGDQIAVVGPSDSIIFQQTEVGGVVDVLVDRFSGIVDPSELVPLVGWDALLWLNSAGDEIARWDSSSPGFVGVYPGDRYLIS